MLKMVFLWRVLAAILALVIVVVVCETGSHKRGKSTFYFSFRLSSSEKIIKASQLSCCQFFEAFFPVLSCMPNQPFYFK